MVAVLEFYFLRAFVAPAFCRECGALLRLGKLRAPLGSGRAGRRGYGRGRGSRRLRVVDDRSCSARLQAGTVGSRRCSPEGERYRSSVRNRDSCFDYGDPQAKACSTACYGGSRRGNLLPGKG